MVRLVHRVPRVFGPLGPDVDLGMPGRERAPERGSGLVQAASVGGTGPEASACPLGSAAIGQWTGIPSGQSSPGGAEKVPSGDVTGHPLPQLGSVTHPNQ